MSNNSFIEETAFDGMRKRLHDDFTRIYHLDLHGDVRRHPDKAGTAYNVFGIQVGVGITIAVRHRKHEGHRVFYSAASPEMRREQKLKWLTDLKPLTSVEWAEILPDDRHTWIHAAARDAFENLIPIGTKDAKDAATEFGHQVIFKNYSLGVSTNRDAVAYGFQRVDLEASVVEFCERYSAEVDRWRRLKRKPKNVDDFVDYEALKWSSTLKIHLVRGDEPTFHASRIRSALYRPFTKRFVYYDDIVVDRPGLFDAIFPDDKPKRENRVICVPTVGSRDRWSVMATDVVPDLHALSNDGFQAFPLHVYSADGQRHDNVTEWWRSTLSERLSLVVGGSEAFNYAYAVFHHPTYRTMFGEVLHRNLPRLPIPESAESFRAFVEAGERLAALHIGYESIEPWPLRWIENPKAALDYRVERLRLSHDRTSILVNDWLTLGDLPRNVFAYALGNRSALEWVIDQYAVERDRDGNIVADPNRADDPEYVVRLIGQVVRVSMETLQIVRALSDHPFPGVMIAS